MKTFDYAAAWNEQAKPAFLTLSPAILALLKRGKGRERCNNVEFIRLENGVRLFPMVLECEADYAIELVINRVGKKH